MTTPENTPSQVIHDFIFENAAHEPVQKRILLYRSLAMEIKDEEIAEQLHVLAEDLEAAEKRHNQLLFNFRARNL